ncbi:anti-sigma factor [Mycolicibacterium obuense]|uniref:Anti-sigma-K factor RskA n=1 Tax=Mycolicibacterium obuense TaxID=1807 RepID=A0A0J6VZ40_9MYCO|nr:anti-sigma factor [Mycolicibacterium obuense]KMO74733.1 Anti-sigma-K factor RskA [Mycolicibacterium obuense]
MTSPEELLTLATPYALHALSDHEADDIDRRLSEASPEVAEAFRAEVRAVRETMAVIAEATAVEPPPELRAQVLRQIQRGGGGGAAVRSLGPKRRRWATVMLAAAAVVAVGLGALGVGVAMRPSASESTTDQIFAAPDVRTVSGDIPGGGTATVVFSRERDSGVLVMNNVTPPKAGTVYQMWLVAADGPHSAGTMDAGAVTPSTTAVLPDLGSSQSLAFTVEPPGGSKEPTTPVFAQLPLV